MTDVTTKELDELISKMYSARTDYDAKKKISNEADAVHKTLKNEVIELMELANKKNYAVIGVGKVSIGESLKVQTPKTNEDKSLLFKWLKDNLGSDGFLAYASVNYNSLNSLYNTQFNETPVEKRGTFKIDGVGNPVREIKLKFNKE